MPVRFGFTGSVHDFTVVQLALPYAWISIGYERQTQSRLRIVEAFGPTLGSRHMRSSSGIAQRRCSTTGASGVSTGQPVDPSPATA